MKEIEHLTKNQIIGYRAGTFDAHETREIGRHLLKCEVCRKSLPALTFDDFWNSVTKEREAESASLLPEKIKFSLAAFRPSLPVFSFATLVLFFGVGLTYLIFIDRTVTNLEGQINSQEPPVETAMLENKPNINIAGNSPANTQRTPAVLDKKRPSSSPSPKSTLPETNNQKNKTSVKTQSSNREIEIAAVRGSNTNSSLKPDIVNAKLSVLGNSLKLNWSKYPQAVSYSVVVSEIENNELIDEIKIEDTTETSISLKKFDPSKKYEVKVVAALPDGTLKTSKTFTFTKNSRKR
jgi:hypothetical protein